MEIQLGYGVHGQTLQIPDQNISGILLPNELPTDGSPDALLQQALANPIGTKPLNQIVHPGEKVVLITSDITRPVPSYVILPPVVEQLLQAGVRREDITVVFGLGSHRPHTEEEKRKLAGDAVFDAIRCVDSNPDDCIRLGHTRRGTPVDITRVVAEADRRICIGNVEFHWFAGFSGGGKAIMPGVSTRAAIQVNHGLMADPLSRAGQLEGNPVREDLEEAAAICGVDFLVNVVLDEHKHIVYAAAGDVTLAHRDACRVLEQRYRTPIDALADIVVVSQGGAPKDLNLYQLQKALDNAWQAVRPGGIVILVGACPEGCGEAVFQQWMTGAATPQDILTRIRTDFCIGGHKAAAFAKVLDMAQIFLVSEMDPELVRTCFLRPFAQVQDALNEAMKQLGPNASVLLMPYGGSTLPCVKKETNHHA